MRTCAKPKLGRLKYKMNQTVLAICITLVVHLVNGQTDCPGAQMVLEANTVCHDALAVGTDESVLCVGTCRYLVDAVIHSCDNMVSE